MIDLIEVLRVAGSLVAGALIGGFYFGGLWWTVFRMTRAKHPMYLYFASLVIRLAVVVTGIYFLVAAWDWKLLVAAFIGFLGIRILLIRFAGGMESTKPVTESVY